MNSLQQPAWQRLMTWMQKCTSKFFNFSPHKEVSHDGSQNPVSIENKVSTNNPLEIYRQGLLRACSNGRLDVARPLLEKLAQEKNGLSPDFIFNSCANEAIKTDHVEIFKLLVNKSSLHQESHPGIILKNLFFNCCERGSIAIMKHILLSEELPMNISIHTSGSSGMFPTLTVEGQALHLAYQAAQLKSIKFLLEEPGLPEHIQVDSTDIYGLTLLEKACRDGALELVKYLLTQCSQKANPYCNDLKALVLAHEADQTLLVEFLMQEYHLQPSGEQLAKLPPILINHFQARDLHEQLQSAIASKIPDKPTRKRKL